MHIVLSIVRTSSLCRAGSSPFRNVARSASSPSSAQARFFTSTFPSGLSTPTPWRRLLLPQPISHTQTSLASSLQLAISRWANSRSGSRLLYRGTPRGGGQRQRSFREESSWKERLDRIPNGYLIIWGIMGLNGLVFGAWQTALEQAQAGDPGLYYFMNKHILLSWKNLTEGRIWTLVASTFSHMDASHFILNAVTFFFMAPPVLQILGNSSFLSLYFLGGFSCNVLSLLMNQQVRDRAGSSNGASGAIFAVASFFACVSPQTKFYVFFVLPLPAWAVVSGIFLWDGYSAITDRRTRTDGAGHVGGILAGVAYYLLKIRRF